MFRKILILLLIIGVVNASNFGSSTKGNIVTIKENQTAEFSLLVWTSDEVASIVDLKIIDSPQNWLVNLEKDSVEISRSQGNEMIHSQDYISATSVKVFANPNGSNPGVYSIIVSATKHQNIGLLAQARQFNLTVIIEGKTKDIKINIPVEPNQSNFPSLLVFVVIIFISALIYRYS